ncbi:DUF2127 domain-containing protein [Paracoccus aminovorans]|uniref:DUF2127 domain-containing protein n=1 Tax=Paracoccus aminovorans TaxID=34004 RepID=UPI0007862D9A|nr:DUF2127 domain-containing protein [Paracoccus aminovorans]MDQ7775299.1 DUF2127 domain-containing protein [Paracoccus aminovorans]
MKHIKGKRGPLHWLFESTLLLKAVFALFEIMAGAGLWWLPHRRLADFTAWLTRNELIEGHRSPVYGRVAAALAEFSATSQHFYALYLLGHGAIKLVIVALLMRRVAFAYPLGIAVFAGFIVMQMHRWTHTQAPALLALSALDAVVIALTWREWRGKTG